MKNKNKKIISIISIILILLSLIPAQVFAISDPSDAIKTTNPSGTEVNGNIYYNKTDVYLRFGESLPSGNWLVEVKEPGNNGELLGSGIINVTPGNHYSLWNNLSLPGSDENGYNDTPNNGQVYHVIATFTPPQVEIAGRFGGNDSNNPITRSDNFKVYQPNIQLIKTVNPLYAQLGDEVTYTFTVSNIGNLDLFDVIVTDPLFGDWEYDVGDLAVGSDPVTFDETFIIPAETIFPLENTATARGYYDDSETAYVEDEDSAIVGEALPAISIEKTVSPEYANIGDEVTYTFTVTNIGNLDLFDINVTDPLFGDWEYDVGDLAVGSDPVIFDETYIIPAETIFPLDNTATVEGFYGKEESVMDSDTATLYEQIDSLYGLSILKTANRTSIEAPASVTYTIVVTNTGNTTLYDVLVEDPLLGFSDTINMLEAGASQTFTLSKTLTLADRNNGTSFVNTATASVVLYGNDLQTSEVPDTLTVSDDATVVITEPTQEPREPREPGEPSEPEPPTEVVPPTEIPLAAPEVPEVEPTEILPEVLPLDVPVLPQTGEIPPALFYSIGGLLSGIGVLIRRRR